MIKSNIKKIPILKGWHEKGYFNKEIRRQRVINFLFKHFLRVNVECPWSVHFTSTVVGADKIKIGDGVERSFILSGGCYIQGGNGIEIGKGTIFAPGVKIISANHNLSNLSHWLTDKPIKIGSFCWIGANAVILPAVELGDNVVVGAGAVVTKSFPSNVTIAGNPAEIIRNRH